MTIAAAWWMRKFTLPKAEERLLRWMRSRKFWGTALAGRKAAGHASDRAGACLEGSSNSNYMRGIAEKAWANGFHAVRLNQRNCGGTELLTPTLYNSAMSSDYRAVLEELVADGFEQVYFAGYSMGGNLVTKMAGSSEKARRGNCEACVRSVHRWIWRLARMNWNAGTTIFIKRDLCVGC